MGDGEMDLYNIAGLIASFKPQREALVAAQKKELAELERAHTKQQKELQVRQIDDAISYCQCLAEEVKTNPSLCTRSEVEKVWQAVAKLAPTHIQTQINALWKQTQLLLPEDDSQVNVLHQGSVSFFYAVNLVTGLQMVKPH